jgi:hypothetical protein
MALIMILVGTFADRARKKKMKELNAALNDEDHSNEENKDKDDLEEQVVFDQN